MKVGQTEANEALVELDSSWIALLLRQFQYLGYSIRRFGFGGIGWWIKTYQQQDDLVIEIAKLNAKIATDQGSFKMIAERLNGFILPEEDQGYLGWYTAAHEKLKRLEDSLNQQQPVSIKQLEEAINELKYISGADQFHEIYQMKSMQKVATSMYQQLQKNLFEQQALEKDKISLAKQKLKSEIARAEADKMAAEAKVKMIESVKLKEQRLAVVEEKKRLKIERDGRALALKEAKELAEIEAKKAEAKRQDALQQSYRELEIKELASELALEELVEIVKRRIEQKKILTFVQSDQLSKLKQIIETKNL